MRKARETPLHNYAEHFLKVCTRAWEETCELRTHSPTFSLPRRMELQCGRIARYYDTCAQSMKCGKKIYAMLHTIVCGVQWNVGNLIFSWDSLL